MNILLDKHFPESGEIILPGLEEKLTLPWRAVYRYDGAVPSILRNVALSQLIARGDIGYSDGIGDRIWNAILDPMKMIMAQDTMLEKDPDLLKLLGYCNEYRLYDGRRAYEIAIRKDLEPSKKIFANGHESGELINKIGARRALQGFLEKAGVDLNVAAFEGEDFADLGGLLALKKAAEKGVEGIELPIFLTKERVHKVVLAEFGF